jgi:hypothetical protein
LVSAGVLHRIERAHAAATALYGATATPTAVELFALAFGSPDPWQQAVLQSDAPRLMLNISRQAGKSSVAAAKAAHTALSRPGALVLVLSPSLRQSGEAFRKIMDVYGAAGRPIPPDSETRLSLDLANGSRVVSLPGKEGTVRGYSGVDLLLIDEASRVPDELYYSVRPMLAVSGGSLIALSTPFGCRGWFHAEWTEGGESWRRFEVPATDCPRISPAFLAEEERSLGPLFFRSEYRCEFVDTVDQVFSHDLVMAALSDDVAPLFAQEVA